MRNTAQQQVQRQSVAAPNHLLADVHWASASS